MSTGAKPAIDELEAVRREIEAIDAKLVDLIAERMQLMRRVGSVKRAAGVPTLDPAREASVIRRASLLARQAGIPDEDVRTIFWRLMLMARAAQAEER